MTSVLSRAIAALRVWLGLNDPAENHPHQPHGWLLPIPADVRSRRLELALSLVPVEAPSSRSRR
jgi:hypothetical protein